MLGTGPSMASVGLFPRGRDVPYGTTRTAPLEALVVIAA